MYKTRNLMNCLEENKHINFNQMCNNFKTFVSVSQFEGPKTHINQVKKARIMYDPIMHTGAFLYGVDDNGALTLLGSVIDSGD